MKFSSKKSIYVGILVTSLILVGCSNNKTTENTTNKETKPVTDNTTTNNKENLLLEEQAKEIALSKVPNGEIIEFSFDQHDTVANYDVTIIDDKYEYEFEINAKDGSIVETSKEILKNKK